METRIIGSKIAKARKEMNMSQAQLAQRLFISPQAVGKWERGASIPDLITFNRLAEILGVDLNYFSENFPSAASGMINTEPRVKQPEEPTSARSEKRLSRDMSRGNWLDADFSGLKNLHEKFGSSNMQRCKFIGSDMSGLLLKSNHIDSCDFSGSDINGSRIQHSHLVKNLFKDCSLKEAEISGSHIKSCNFSGADLSGAVFTSGAFVNNTMANAILQHTSFNTMQIDDIIFNSNLEDCSFENCSFTGIVRFQNARLTNTFFKNNRNLKRVRFIDCTADKITYAFLKNGKADLGGITLLTT